MTHKELVDQVSAKLFKKKWEDRKPKIMACNEKLSRAVRY